MLLLLLPLTVYLGSSETTKCVVLDYLCRGQQSLLPTTEFVADDSLSKDKVCRGRQILSFYFMTNFVFCDKLCRWRQH